MSKRTSKPKVFAFDAKDKATRIKAERLEIHLGKGRKLLLSFPGSAWGDLEVEAETDSDEVVPLLSLQPGACNLLTLRVDLDHDLRPVEAMDLPQHDSPPMLTLKVQKAVEGADKTNSPKKHSIRRWAQAALQQDVKVVVRLVGEAEGQAQLGGELGAVVAAAQQEHGRCAGGRRRGAELLPQAVLGARIAEQAHQVEEVAREGVGAQQVRAPSQGGSGARVGAGGAADAHVDAAGVQAL